MTRGVALGVLKVYDSMAPRNRPVTSDQIEALNSSLIELIKSYRMVADDLTEQQLLDFNDTHPLADVLFDVEAYLEEAGLLDA